MARRKIIPKRVGRVKIPKAVRRFGDRVLDDPRSREVAGQALVALGSALLAKGGARGAFLRDILARGGARPGPAPREEPPRRGAGPAQGADAGKAGQGAAAGGMAETVAQAVGDVIDSIRRDMARKVRPVRPRHAHDEPEETEGGPNGGPNGGSRDP